MTGFGKATANHKGKTLSVEIRSLNSKFLELTLRLPDAFREKELELRAEISKELERGKIEVTVSAGTPADSEPAAINEKAIEKYLKALKPFEKKYKITTADFFASVLQLPQVSQQEAGTFDENTWNNLQPVLKKAIKNFNLFREKEGNGIFKEMELRVKNIETLLTKIEIIEPERMSNTRERLKKAFYGMDDNLVDKNRFEQELIFYLEKMDITEEKVRLRSHCNYFIETIKSKESNGKKIGFIAQEMGREINTIGSKANDADIQRSVVEMKDELEKIKEQSANVI